MNLKKLNLLPRHLSLSDNILNNIPKNAITMYNLFNCGK